MKTGHKITPFLVLGTIITILLLVFSITTILGIRNMDSAIKQEEHTYQANTKKLEELRSIAEHENEYKHSISVMNQLIPDQMKDSDIVSHIDSFCKIVGVDLIEVGFGNRVVNSSVNVLPLELKLRCRYLPFMELVKEMTSGERLIRIDEMSITQDGGSSDHLNVDLSVRTFYR